MPDRLFLCTPGFEAALCAELPAELHARAAPELPGLVSAREPEGETGHVPPQPYPLPPSGSEGKHSAVPELRNPPSGPLAPRSGERGRERGPREELDPVFARQQLPNAVAVAAPSVAAAAEACYAAVQASVDASGGPFTIHAFALTGAGEGLGSRAALIAAALLERLRERRRRASRAYRPPEEAAARFGDLSLLIQVLVVDRERAWVSAAKPQPLPSGGWTLAPWPGGVAPVADDKRPPSRAYRKLEEALLWMGDAPKAGQTCVDLGAAPGGWTYVALARGARVTAVDRAPVEPPVRGHRALTMVEGNAFTYQPPRPVDWLVCDVISEPARTVELLGKWLTKPWCRRLVVTVKFKGQSGYAAVLDDVRATLRAAGCPRWRIKHLHHNKNEVTVLASARAARTSG